MSRKIELLSIGLLMLVSIILFTPVLNGAMTPGSDYDVHANYIQRLLDGQDSLDTFLRSIPHFLYHLLTVLIGLSIFGGDLMRAGFVLNLALYALTGAVLYGLFWLYVGRPSTYRAGFSYALMALVLLLVTPITVLSPNNMYLGYLAVNVYHNPTITLLKPLALVLVICAVWVFTPPVKPLPRWSGLAYGLITVACLLAKPNFVLILLPALAVVTLYRLVNRQPIHWRLLLGGIVIPASLLLGVQMVFFSNKGSILFAPLAVMRAWDRINPAASSALSLKILLSVLFPLVVYVSYWSQAARTLYLNLAWLAAITGAGFTYLLAEGGSRLEHGNLTWSGQIGMFVLFAATSGFLLEQNRGWLNADKSHRLTLQRALCLLTLALHLISGILWYRVYISGISLGDIIRHVW